MNYWYVWPIGIAVWSLLGWFAFGYFEHKALQANAGKNQITLSFFLYTLSRWQPLILIVGLVVGAFIGGLGVHVLWHWCPPGSVTSG